MKTHDTPRSTRTDSARTEHPPRAGRGTADDDRERRVIPRTEAELRARFGAMTESQWVEVVAQARTRVSVAAVDEFAPVEFQGQSHRRWWVRTVDGAEWWVLIDPRPGVYAADGRLTLDDLFAYHIGSWLLAKDRCGALRISVDVPAAS